MTANELVIAQLADTHLQVTMVYEGLPESGWTQCSNPQAFTPRQTLAHLTECCQAMLSDDPNKYEWGSFDDSGFNNDELMAKFNELRSKCVEKASNSTDDQVLSNAVNFLALHEAYHVGQLVTLRLSLDPDWNSYSIYGM